MNQDVDLQEVGCGAFSTEHLQLSRREQKAVPRADIRDYRKDEKTDNLLSLFYTCFDVTWMVVGDTPLWGLQSGDFAALDAGGAHG